MPQGISIPDADPLAHCVRTLLAPGRIVAMKGLGGYHLVCDAYSETAVNELRRRKHRDEKPFAIMVPDVAAARALCEVNPDERELLGAASRPIVLLRKRPGTAIAEAVAPRNPHLGIMLPYTPLHHLLLQGIDGRALVMTSGNRSDEPIAFDDSDAVERLAGIADVFLTHNRPIHVRCDDSVTRTVDKMELPLRRSRGYAPYPIPLPIACPVPILAVGGQFERNFLPWDESVTHSRATTWATSITSPRTKLLSGTFRFTNSFWLFARASLLTICIPTMPRPGMLSTVARKARILLQRICNCCQFNIITPM